MLIDTLPSAVSLPLAAPTVTHPLVIRPRIGHVHQPLAQIPRPLNPNSSRLMTIALPPAAVGVASTTLTMR